jgi:SAM-dependent methyltransferase|tara:strand:- start:13079 stop:13870 length:792 start_codon:yes stop_codon:yes gene_type:complete
MTSILSKLKKKLESNKLLSSDIAHSQIQCWFKSKYGKYLISEESKVLRKIFADIGSHRMIRLGVTSASPLFFTSNHLQTVSFGLSKDTENNAISDLSALPLSTETIDTVLLHHSLELSQDPHEVLKEASRVLKSTGHLVIVVFNPISLFGLLAYPARLISCNPLWRRHNIRCKRLVDWLKLLNIKPVKEFSGGYLIASQLLALKKNKFFLNKIINKYQILFGAFYIILAKKYVSRPVSADYKTWKKLNIPTGAHKKSIFETRS